MGKLINVEESTYVSGIIDQYAQNKVGQYSKYLNLTPTFVTYYAVNQVQSRTDTGTGSVAAERGYNSPLRFNKIKGLPVYNLPILSPDINYDETGMDIDLDLSDITLLPNTVKPTVPDYMLVELPGSTKVLFRVNSYRYNTIQSNDFVSISLDIKAMGPNAEESIEPLVVKTYYTIFENIGTEDKCFIEEEDVATVNDLSKTIGECIDTYTDLYWDELAGGFLLSSNTDPRKVIYDVFLTRFIDETDIFPHTATTLTTLAFLDYVPHGSDLLYRRSLLYAVQNRTNKYLYDKMKYYLGAVTHPFSPLIVYNYTAYTVKLLLIAEDVAATSSIYEYYDRLLKWMIRDGSPEYPSIPVVEPDEPVVDPENPDEGETTDPEDPDTGGETTDPENPDVTDPDTGETTDPENPDTGDVTDPTDPETPDETDPEVPTDPDTGETTDPENPDVTDPEAPTDPETPDTGDTTDPVDPDTGDITEPTDPETPDETDPVDPVDPEVPTDPDPEVPTDPDTGDPIDPVDPEVPIDPDTGETTDPENPDTEDTTDPPITEDDPIPEIVTTSLDDDIPVVPDDTDVTEDEDTPVTDPEVPDTTDPADPENPDTEDTTNPETPDVTDPEVPDTGETTDPENPDTTDPVDPDVPTDPDTGENVDPENPDITDPTDPENPDDTDTPVEDEPVEEPDEPVVTDSFFDEFEAPAFKNEEKVTELTEEDIALIQSYDEDQIYIFNLILKYMCNLPTEIDTSHLIYPLMTKGRFSYFYGPVLIYVLWQQYNQYFSSVTDSTDE